MRFKIKNLDALIKKGESEYGASATPIAIIFKSDDEMRRFCNHMLSLDVKEGERWFVQAPAGYDKVALADFMEMPVEEMNTQPSKNIFG